MNAMLPPLTHDARLDLLAQVAVNVGLGLVPGQEVVLTAPLAAVPLVRRITEHAYKAGASLVTTLLLSDEVTTLARFAACAGQPPSTTPRPGCSKAWPPPIRQGAARMAIGGENPALLARAGSRRPCQPASNKRPLHRVSARRSS